MVSRRACARRRPMPTRTQKSRGPGLPTLRPSSRAHEARGRWEQQSPVPRESAKDGVKTIVQGMPDDLAGPVVTAASFFCCWRAMGEAVARHSLRPLFSWRAENNAQLGSQGPRDRANAPSRNAPSRNIVIASDLSAEAQRAKA